MENKEVKKKEVLTITFPLADSMSILVINRQFSVSIKHSVLHCHFYLMNKTGFLIFTNLFLKCRGDLLTPLRLEVASVGQILIISLSIAEKCLAINLDKTSIQIQGNRQKNAAHALRVSTRNKKMQVYKFYPKFNSFNP